MLFQPVPEELSSKIEIFGLPEKYWDGYGLAIDFFLARCGSSKIKTEKNKALKVKKLLEKACKNRDCSNFLQARKKFDERNLDRTKIKKATVRRPYNTPFYQLQYFETSFRRKHDGSYEVVRRPRT